MPGVRSVAFGAWVRAASLHEPREKMGVSHLLEHMVFKGTERAQRNEIALVARGARRLARRVHVARAHRLSGARARRASARSGRRHRRPRVSARRCARPISTLERKVVLEEIGMVEDTPDDLVFELHNEALWGDASVRLLDSRHARHASTRSSVADCARCTTRAYHPGQHRRRRGGQRRARRSCSTSLERTGWTTSPSRRRDAARSSAPPLARRRRRTSRRARGRADAHRRRQRRPCRTAIRVATRCCCSACCSAAA